MPVKPLELKDPELPKAIGGRFLRAREELRITHQNLVKATGVSRQSIGRFERGERGMQGAGLVSVLSAAAELGIDLNYVFTGKRDAAVRDALKTITDPDVLAGLRALGQTHSARTRKPTGTT